MREETRARMRLEKDKKEARGENTPVYIYQCVVCRKKFKTSLVDYRHCEKLTQWVAGIEGIGINGQVKAKEEKKIKVQVSGFIEMKERDFKVIMGYNDPVRGFILSIPMPFCDSEGLEFLYEE